MMLRFLCLLSFSLLTSSVASAQAQDSSHTIDHRFYVGVGFPNFQYRVLYDDIPKKPRFVSGEFIPIDVHLGYKINKRASAQLGLAYSGRTRESQTYGVPLNGNGQTVYHTYYDRTRGIGLPVTGRFVLLNANKKMPIYAVATFTSAYIFSHFRETTTENYITTTLYDEQYKGIDLFTTAGFGLSYRVQKRLNGNVEFLFFKRNLTSPNFDMYNDRWFVKMIKSLSVSFNYNFN
ncbi:outer membrane beta-barrel protein [Nibribacter ruber]|uniref:Outer membrane beta-barrel protein n=1 Tax=Nibribacter ruber TaxID=2698458 RepID=A0A6P1NZK0_9BACT|nr:outer membrane beta-barrel protein [Nibribacter ruber]QHL85992.1 outer membrane beta-barrel protein [Nibribacter ruber]